MASKVRPAVRRPVKEAIKTADKASKGKAGSHLALLEQFANRAGGKPTPGECIALLQNLRAARDTVLSTASSTRQTLLRRWEEECLRHPGFAKLRASFLEEDTLETLGTGELSRTYNSLRRLNFSQDADRVWAPVSGKLAKDEFKNPEELLGLWTVAPKEYLAKLDGPLSRAADRNAGTSPRLRLSVIGRASEMPNSKAVLHCASKLMTAVSDMSSDDIVLVIFQLGAKAFHQQQAVPDALRKIVRNMKRELVHRDGKLGTMQLCNLLGALDDSKDPLWPLVRRQLLTAKDLTAPQALAVCRFASQPGVEDAELLAVGKARVQSLLAKDSQDQPGLVTLLATHLDLFVSDAGVCRALLNTALRLRKDIFPAVLWKLFIRMGETGLLARHPALRGRAEQVGETLESHGPPQLKTMTLGDMAGIVAAMRANNVVLPKCSDKMAQRAAEILRKAVEDFQPSAAPGHEAAVPDLLSEVQRLAVSLWVQLQQLGHEEPALTAAVTECCASHAAGHMHSSAVAHCLAELQSLDTPAAEALRTVLAEQLVERLPTVSPRALREAAAVTSHPGLWQAVAQEVGRRVDSIRFLRRGLDFDDLLATLAQLSAAEQPRGGAAGWTEAREVGEAGEAELAGPGGVALRGLRLLAVSLPQIVEQEPEVGVRRLSATAQAFAALGSADSTVLQPLRRSVRRLGTTLDSAARAQPEEVAGLAFQMAAMHGGALPFEVAARLWSLVGGLAEAPGFNVDRLPAQSAAWLWAFGLAAGRLSSPTTLAALRLAPEAPAVEALMARIERRDAARLALQSAADVAARASQLRAALPIASPNASWEEGGAVPGTPYVVDFASADARAAVLVPRPSHRAPLTDQLSGHGRLLERTLEAMGWRTLWVWPEEWSSRFAGNGEAPKDELVESLHSLLSDARELQ